MLKKISFALIAVLASVGISMASLPAQTSALFEGSTENACRGINATEDGKCKDGKSKISNTLKTVINLLSTIVGVAAVIMVIIGGFRYVTSNGDSATTASARNTIIYALVGLVLAAFGQVLVQFVLERT